MKVLVFFLLFIPFCSISQTEESLTEFVSALSKQKFKISDTITVGIKESINQLRTFQNKSSNFNYNTIFISHPPQFWNLTTDIRGEKIVITKIQKNKVNFYQSIKDEVIVEAKSKTGELYYILIEKAIAQKEIVSFEQYIDFDRTEGLSPAILYVLAAKNNKFTTDQMVTTWLKLTDKEKLNQWESNEFQKQREQNEIKRKIDSVKNGLSSTDTFSVLFEVEFNPYNFQTSSFPILENDNFMSGFVFDSKMVNLNAAMPYVFTFVNYDAFKNVKVSPEKAEFFVLSKNSNYGMSRTAYVFLEFVVVKIVPSKYICLGSEQFAYVPEYQLKIVNAKYGDCPLVTYNALD